MSEPCRLRRGEGYGTRDDAMGFCTLHREVRFNAIALCGLYEGGLDTCLRDNPHLRHVVLCLDDDGPGQEAAGGVRGPRIKGVHPHAAQGQGLEARKCEWCEAENVALEVHHACGLKDLKGKDPMGTGND